MKVIDTLNKSRAYRLKDLTLRQKTQIFEEVYGEMYGKGTSIIRYVNGSYRNQAMGVVYLTDIEQWRAQLSVNIAIAESLVPFFRVEIKREYKNSQFIVI